MGWKLESAAGFVALWCVFNGLRTRQPKTYASGSIERFGKDPKKLTELVSQIDALLEAKEQRLKGGLNSIRQPAESD
jgi:hypothetical protein